MKPALKRPALRTLSPIIGAIGLACLLPSAVLGQPAPYLAGAAHWHDGVSGISGLWDMQGYLSSSTNSARARAARTVDGQMPPLLPGPAAILEKRLVDADNEKPFPNMASQCLPQGVPYMLFAAVGGPLQILETPGQVTFISDAYNEMWLVPLGGQHPPIDEIEPSFHGHSVGRWEGDVLVIDTVALNTKTTLDQVGMPHSEGLHVITRVRRTDPQTLEFLVTIDDPKTFATAWDRRVTYKKAPRDAHITEVVCENQRNPIGDDGFQSILLAPEAHK